MVTNRAIRMVLILMLLFMLMYSLLVTVFRYSNPDLLFLVVHFLVRAGTCGIFAFLAFERLRQNLRAQAALFGVLALMFFPSFPVHFPQIFWSVLDIAAIGIVAFSIAGDREEAPGGISQSMSGEGDVHRAVNDREGFPWPLVLGVFVGPAFGVFWVVGLFLPAYFEIDVFPDFLNLTILGIVSIIVLIGTGVLSLFLNIYVIRKFRARKEAVPRRYLLPIPYYFMPLLVIIDAFSEPYVDIGSIFILQALVLGGLVALGFALAVGAGLVAFYRRPGIDRGNGDHAVKNPPGLSGKE